MPVYKLSYFKAKGRAEVTRMLFTLAGQEFEDIRLEGESWQKFKPKTPMGAVPVLEIDDVMICQTNAIARYVARKFGYGGKNELDQARVDMVVDCLEEITPHLMAFFQAKSDEEKASLRAKFQNELAPGFLTKFENILKQNNGGNGWFVGDDITWADVQFLNMIDLLSSQMGIDVGLDKFEKLNALKRRTEEHPKIKEWIAKRPK